MSLPQPFADTPLSDSELPDFLSRAAARAVHARRKKYKESHFADITNSPGFSASPLQARQVAKLAALGVPVKDIATVLGIEKTLLTFYYEYEIKTAKARTNAAVAKVALDMALSGQNENMTKFWLQARAGWKTTDVVEHEGVDAAADEAKAARAKLLGDV